MSRRAARDEGIVGRGACKTDCGLWSPVEPSGDLGSIFGTSLGTCSSWRCSGKHELHHIDLRGAHLTGPEGSTAEEQAAEWSHRRRPRLQSEHGCTAPGTPAPLLPAPLSPPALAKQILNIPPKKAVLALTRGQIPPMSIYMQISCIVERICAASSSVCYPPCQFYSMTKQKVRQDGMCTLFHAAMDATNRFGILQTTEQPKSPPK